MSTHTIHNIQVSISVSQGNMSDISRDRCVGKVVNLCRAMIESDFLKFINDLDSSLQGTKYSADMLNNIDSALSDNYTKKYIDDLSPIVDIQRA